MRLSLPSHPARLRLPNVNGDLTPVPSPSGGGETGTATAGR